MINDKPVSIFSDTRHISASLIYSGMDDRVADRPTAGMLQVGFCNSL